MRSSLSCNPEPKESDHPEVSGLETFLGSDELNEKLDCKWDLMENQPGGGGIEGFCRRNWETFARRLSRGVPYRLRWRAWRSFITSKYHFKLPSSHSLLRQQNAPFADLIAIDVPRTFPDLYVFDHAAQAKLYRVLSAYAIFRPEIGYCQGMNFVAGFILLVSDFKEEETFQVFTTIMEKYHLNGFFCEHFPLLYRFIEVFDGLAEEEIPNVRRHFVTEGIIPPMFLHQWLLTLFVTCLPLRSVVVLWDFLIVEGLSSLLRLAITLLKVLQPFLLELKFEKAVRFLKSLRESGTQSEVRVGRLLVRQARKIIIPNFLLEKLYANASSTKAVPWRLNPLLGQHRIFQIPMFQFPGYDVSRYFNPNRFGYNTEELMAGEAANWSTNHNNSANPADTPSENEIQRMTTTPSDRDIELETVDLPNSNLAGRRAHGSRLVQETNTISSLAGSWPLHPRPTSEQTMSSVQPLSWTDHTAPNQESCETLGLLTYHRNVSEVGGETAHLL